VEATGLAVSGSARDIDRGVIRGGIVTTYVSECIDCIRRMNLSTTEFPEIYGNLAAESVNYVIVHVQTTLPH
jgi:hypothetical protein